MRTLKFTQSPGEPRRQRPAGGRAGGASPRAAAGAEDEEPRPERLGGGCRERAVLEERRGP